MKIIFYEKPGGRKPALDFIESLEQKLQVKVIGTIKLLEEKGNGLSMPYSRKLDRHINELRARHGTDIARVLYFFTEGDIACLTNGFVKKTEKTPPGEIHRANVYRNRFLGGKM